MIVTHEFIKKERNKNFNYLRVYNIDNNTANNEYYVTKY